ncbi:MAG: glycoside hydrolase family 25 protein [Lachnospiraceae bacterium]|nr:glycoside hydrolase family 25 protein [Lachnospiraceae bacterium]
MDSKLRRSAVLASLAIVLLLLLIVLLLNSQEVHSGGRTGQSTQAAQDGSAMQMQTGQQEAKPETDTARGQIGNDLSAFMKDNTFFDEDVNPVLEAAKDNSNRLSLIMTSVEKDLRIQIVDTQGIPVEGESFYVSLEGKGEYKDLDKDGIIYIGDLEAGEYYVELLPIAGYRVPVNETRIRVKDRVEYLAIEDISLLIKTEEEIDAEGEDTAVWDANEDADKTEIKRLQTASGNRRIGIDVSKWNGDIDWDKVKRSGVEYAIVRAGYRGSKTGAIVEDPYFRANMRGAAASDVLTGVYFFTQATNEVEAVEEASAVLQLIADFKLDYPIYIDTEGAGGNGRADRLDVETRTQVSEAFCRTIENAGYQAGVYASRHWYNNNLETRRLEKYSIWLAEYRSVPLYQGYYKMWQYTSKGSVDGIVGNVDIDISYE